MLNLIYKSKLLCLALMLYCLHAQAGKVDTVVTHSNSMNKDIKAVVICPDHYSKHHNHPVLYLLHGFSGNYSDWINKVPAIAKLADEYQLIIVCPDGNFSSWYFDSPVNPELKYETYISKELVGWVDAHYTTINNSSGRAISGLSMGGQGALYLAIRHPDIYGAAGSMSGGVDLVPFAKSFGLAEVLGKYEEYPQRWKESSAINMLDQIKPGSLAIIFDCGYNDFFYQANLLMNERMVDKKIPHDFTVRAGGHTWEYWGNSIVYQMLFFSRYFSTHNLIK